MTKLNDKYYTSKVVTNRFLCKLRDFLTKFLIKLQLNNIFEYVKFTNAALCAM